MAVWALFLFLLLPVRVQLRVNLGREESAACLEAGALLLRVRQDGVFKRRKGKLLFVSRYERTKGKEKVVRMHAGSEKKLFVEEVLGHACWERFTVHAAVGMGSALSTAIAAGSIQAGVMGLLTASKSLPPCRLFVQPDFEGRTFAADAVCIFSVKAGDIILAAGKAALKMRKKEGSTWKSIPSKA